MSKFADWIIKKVSVWLVKNDDSIPCNTNYTNFNEMCRHIKPGDVLLVAGRNRISTIIRHITYSPWSHATLYIGRLRDISDPAVRQKVEPFAKDDPEKQLVIESEMGTGTSIMALDIYRKEHIRLMRPKSLTKEDAETVVNSAIARLGTKYDVRHILDLARFVFPWGLFPRRWRSSLFQHNALQPTKDICSSMIAEAFESVDFPILPLIEKDYENQLEFIRRNDLLYTPSDFDYSPYFEVLKYPQVPLTEPGAYHDLPWMSGVISNDEGDKFVPILGPTVEEFFTSHAYGVVGATNNRDKFGNKVLRCYLQLKKKVYPVNPKEDVIEGLKVVHHVSELPHNVKSISIITPPAITEKIVEEAVAKGIQNIWMQPGAESDLAIKICKDNNINVIAGGLCLLKMFGFREDSSSVKDNSSAK